jgi:transcriptional regulator of acetoin/glycerol metabolism
MVADRLSPKQHLQIVKNFAHQIETANLMLNSRRNWVIKLWSRQDFASVETEYVIALDSEGAIISINQAALHLLANEIGGDWRRIPPRAALVPPNCLSCPVRAAFCDAVQVGPLYTPIRDFP